VGRQFVQIFGIREISGLSLGFRYRHAPVPSVQKNVAVSWEPPPFRLFRVPLRDCGPPAAFVQGNLAMPRTVAQRKLAETFIIAIRDRRQRLHQRRLAARVGAHDHGNTLVERNLGIAKASHVLHPQTIEAPVFTRHSASILSLPPNS
jgi:hypothetical protein